MDQLAVPAQPVETDEVLDRLNAMGESLAEYRQEAIQGRIASGIEDIWREDEEHYEGIDDANRGTRNKTNWQSKPPGQAFPGVPDNQSTEFVNITRPYVDAAASKVGDILLPTDERSWGLTETPVPELLDAAQGNVPQDASQLLGVVAIDHPTPDQAAQRLQQVATQILAEARAKAEKAQKRIEDWHVECQFHGEVRKVIEDCCRIGSGVLKGPIPQNKRSVMFSEEKQALAIKDEIKPVSKRIDPWNFYPDPACGESIHRGNYVWERDNITYKMLEALKDDPGYLGQQIDLCLEEGPKRQENTHRETADGKKLDDKSLFEIWYYHGTLKQEDLEAAGVEVPDGASVSIPAIVTMVNDRVIKAALNPLDTGEFPYDVMPWQRRKNMPWGFGVSRQIRAPQRIVVAGWRTLLTNAGRASGPIFLRKRNVVAPLDGSEDIIPWKQYSVAEDDTADDVSKAMVMLTIPDLRESLMSIIQAGLKMAEDVTGLPLLLQGQAGNAPETYGGQQLVDRNASTTLRRIARQFDDHITEPHVRRYYAWLLQYGEDEEKGEFILDAHGSQALVDRELIVDAQQMLFQAALNPAFGLDPEKIMNEWLRAKRVRVQDVQLTDQQKQQKAQQAAQQAQQAAAEGVQIAQINAASQEKRVSMELSAEQQLEQMREQFQQKEKAKDRQLQLIVNQILEHIEGMKLTGEQEIAFQQLKAELADTSMKLSTQKDLSLADKMVELHKHRLPQGHAVPQVITPPTEPVGRAPPGEAFEK